MRGYRCLPLLLVACSGGSGGGGGAALRIDTPSPLPAATIGVDYNLTLAASAGTGTHWWSVVEGTLPDGLELEGDTIRGTPYVEGTYDFAVRVEDAVGASAMRALELTVTPEGGALAIVTQTLPTAATHVPYEAHLTASGGDGTYAWYVDAGDFPPGLSITAAGSPSTTIVGAPVDVGSFTFRVRVEDTSGGAAMQTYTLDVTSVGTLQLVTDTLPDGRLGARYDATLTAAGGAGDDYTWAITSGALPAGLSVGALGTPSTTIAGTPTEFGSFDFTVTVTDADGAWGERSFSLRVDSDVLAITPATIPGATLGAAYMTTLMASGGNDTRFTWALRAGETLPPGLELVDNGPAAILAGTPTTRGTFPFTVDLTNQAGERAEIAYTLAVGDAITIDTAALPPARDGVPYDLTLAASGGSGGYVWLVASGALPSGLTLANGRVSGTTRARGVYPLTLRVTDAGGGSAEAAFTLEVTAPFAITPTALPNPTICTADRVTLTAVGGQGAHSWSLSGALPDGWLMRPSNTATIELVGRPTSAGSATFTLTVTDAVGASVSQMYTVVVADDPAVQRWAVLVGDALIDEDRSVFLVDVCGATPGAMTRISPDAPGTGDASAAADSVQFAPDGTAVAFIGDFNNDGNPNLYVYDLTSLGSAVNVTNYTATGASVQDVYWAPNSDYIAFTADPSVSGHDQLFFVDVTNRALPGAPILVNGGSAPADSAIDVMPNDVFWSPSSDQLVYLGDLDTSGVNELYRTRVSNPATPTVGTKIHSALSGSQDCDDDVVWAPDGSGVLFRCDLETYNVDELWFARFVGAVSTVARVNNAGYGDSNDVGLGDYAFSPPGTRVLYLADEQHDGAQELWVATYAGGTFTTPVRAIAPLAPDRSVTSAKWNPAGTKIAFRADLDVDERFELYVVDVSGALPATPVRVSTMQPEGDLDASTSEGFAYEWSPDGTKLAFIGDMTMEGVDQIYVALAAPPYTVAVAGPAASDATLDATNFHFAPDGQRLAVRGDFATDGAYDLYVTRLDTGPPYVTQAVSMPMPTNGDVNTGDGAFGFRADGLGLFFEADMLVNDDVQIWTVDLTGQQPSPPVAVGSTPTMGGDYLFFRLNR